MTPEKNLHTFVNIYRYKFVSACPNNGEAIIYSLEIHSAQMIQAEHIILACKLLKSAYHESIADELYHRFGQRQVICAHHHGIDIETRRGIE